MSFVLVPDTRFYISLFIFRSGSTLLETMLDSHSRIWGMGEDSFFNANLTEFRNKLVGAPSQKGKILRHAYFDCVFSLLFPDDKGKHETNRTLKTDCLTVCT